jgi:predicted alpha/beta superfamily hydrolase
MREWQVYVDPNFPNTVAGALRLLPEVHSPQLNVTRSILVHLPPTYHQDTEKRYPVIYMHDGENLFDFELAQGDEWGVDETLFQLVEEGLEALVVGIPSNQQRLDEYSPFVDEKYGGGKGEAYLAYIVEVVKPIVDEDFRTLPQRATTGIIGSSMGGLISLYSFFHPSQVFGFVGVFSPALWFANQAMMDYVRNLAHIPDGKIYLDTGQHELPDSAEASAQHTQLVRDFGQLLLEKGFIQGQSLLYHEDEHGTHSEQDWARRLPDALRFLLASAMQG